MPVMPVAGDPSTVSAPAVTPVTSSAKRMSMLVRPLIVAALAGLRVWIVDSVPKFHEAVSQSQRPRYSGA